MKKLTKKKRKRAKLEKLREQGKQSLLESQEKEEKFRLENKRKKRRKTKIIAAVLACMLLLSIFIVYLLVSPGRYDDFAKCLTDKGAVMYGEDWCQYTNAQKAMFGKSFKYIDYQVKSNLKVRPTWVIDGKSYGTVQSFQRLSALTGCEI